MLFSNHHLLSAPSARNLAGHMRAFATGILAMIWAASASAFPTPTSDWIQVARTGVLASGSSPAVVRNNAILDVFIRGLDNHLWHVEGKQGTWGSWRRDPNGVFTRDPIAVNMGGGRARVFVRGVDNRIWYVDYFGGTFSLWQTACPAGILASNSNPAVSLVGAATDFYIRGTDNGLWHSRLVGNTCSGWTRHPSIVFNGDPAIGGSDGFSTTVVFRGQDTRLWATSFSSAGWGNTYQVDALGLLGSSPSTLSSNLSYEVFIRGANGQTRSPLWAFTTWERIWQPIAPQTFLFSGRPAISHSIHAGRAYIDMFVNGPGNHLWYRTLTDLLPPT